MFHRISSKIKNGLYETTSGQIKNHRQPQPMIPHNSHQSHYSHKKHPRRNTRRHQHSPCCSNADKDTIPYESSNTCQWHEIRPPYVATGSFHHLRFIRQQTQERHAAYYINNGKQQNQYSAPYKQPFDDLMERRHIIGSPEFSTQSLPSICKTIRKIRKEEIELYQQRIDSKDNTCVDFCRAGNLDDLQFVRRYSGIPCNVYR